MTKTKLNPVLPYIGIPVICFAWLLFRAGQTDTLAALRYMTLIVFGYITAVLDIKMKKIPNNLILVMLSAWVLIMAQSLIFEMETAIKPLISSVIGFTVSGGMFMLVYLISRKGLGGGDVKFIAAAGLYLGTAGILSAMLCGTVLAALTGMALILLKKIGRKDPIPLAPFLYAGILITVFL